uniref:Uncharacterized protein n=1 Tax=Vespula pensylvanica TaxID=30213 RepID=A0A834UH30_VESPE|nr:hypothetical protein H0235_001265 [Vespula pensylvanica]
MIETLDGPTTMELATSDRELEACIAIKLTGLGIEIGESRFETREIDSNPKVFSSICFEASNCPYEEIPQKCIISEFAFSTAACSTNSSEGSSKVFNNSRSWSCDRSSFLSVNEKFDQCHERGNGWRTRPTHRVKSVWNGGVAVVGLEQGYEKGWYNGENSAGSSESTTVANPDPQEKEEKEGQEEEEEGKKEEEEEERMRKSNIDGLSVEEKWEKKKRSEIADLSVSTIAEAASRPFL